MKKKIIGIVLAAALVNGMSLGNVSLASEDVPTVKMMVMDLSGTGLPDVQLVEDKINEYLVPEANARLELEVVSAASYQDTLTMRVASGESVDIAVISDAQLAPLQRQGMFKDMSDLIQEYGQDILAAFSDNDIQYLLDSGIPGNE